MSEESFVMLSLKEGKAKKLTQVLSNETARKILDYLSTKKEATETHIAQDLKLPLSTVHYNLKQLAENKLVKVDEFHYSEKGKEVIHYRLANKYIIIAPAGEEENLLEKLKSFLPMIGILAVISIVIAIVQNFSALTFSRFNAVSAGNTMMKVADEAVAAKAAPMMAEVAGSGLTQTTSNPQIAAWFFIGGIFVLLLILLGEFIGERKNRVKKAKEQ